MSITTESIRNIALTGHAGSGKTSLLEAVLVAAGVIGSAGSVARGGTVSDFAPLEKERGHSIDTTVATFQYNGHRLNLLDTPGYADFRGPAIAALAAVETCVVVVNAANGVEYSTRRMMRYAERRNLPRMLVVNHMDAEHANLPAVIEELRQEFGTACLPVNLPAADGSRVIDCFERPADLDDAAAVADWHQQIIDQVVEVNERLMGRYLDKGEEALDIGELHGAFEQCLREAHLVPICFTSATTGAGVQEWLDIAITLLPDPREGNPPLFHRVAADASIAVTVAPDPAQSVIAHVFKIVNDPFAGKLGVFRVHQGTINKDSQLFIDNGRKAFKVGHLFRLMGRERTDIDSAVPGDMAAVAKIDDIRFDSVLHDGQAGADIRMAPLPFPQPMFGLAVVPRHKGQEQKLALALTRLTEEDPCFRVEHHKELNETVIYGLGDLHLKVMLERMRERYGVEVDTTPPRIAYRETIGASAEGHHRHKKQTGGAGQFGEVSLRVEPLARGEGFTFVDETKGGTIPNQFLPAIEKGIVQAMAEGAVAGYPMQDVRVVVLDGKHHPVDSKEVAFISAGRKAFLDAVGKARPQVLEPIVNIEVRIPEDNVGDVTGALAAKRARILGTDALRNGVLIVKAQVPLAELEGYPIELKAMTGGAGRYVMELSHYEQVPAAVQQSLADAWKPSAEPD